MRPAALDAGIDPQVRDDCARLVEIMRRFVGSSWRLLDTLSPRAARELNGEVKADRVRLVVECDVRYPGKIELVATNNSGERYCVTRLTLDRADPDFLRVIIPDDDGGTSDNVVLN